MSLSRNESPSSHPVLRQFQWLIFTLSKHFCNHNWTRANISRLACHASSGILHGSRRARPSRRLFSPFGCFDDGQVDRLDMGIGQPLANQGTAVEVMRMGRASGDVGTSHLVSRCSLRLTRRYTDWPPPTKQPFCWWKLSDDLHCESSWRFVLSL